MFRELLQQVLSSRRKPGFPLIRYEESPLSESYEGPVVTSDIDKTYLDTRFHSFRDLVRTALEPAESKRSLPGMGTLLHSFQQGNPPTLSQIPLYFISASPPMMREVLLEKMKIDGIQPNGLTLKDPIRLVRKGRWRHLRHHILYKLTALLLNRHARPIDANIQEVLIGDDSETDAETYLFYRRLLRKEVTEEEFHALLGHWGATSSEGAFLRALLERDDNSQVARIYIHRTTHKALEKLPPHDRNEMIAALDSMQIAADAFLEGWLSGESLCRVAEAFGPLQLLDSARDAQQRKIFTQEQCEQIDTALQSAEMRYLP
ncbi:MAG: hypothetical protein H6728_10925 [Myxococcales bacterium]|nr:hypothetical protein [Myxococcales bacterium]MCB9643573.1 hypothetical protein [Myxococcales bacterium]